MAVSEIDVDQLEALEPRSIQLIDVREPAEYEQARVPGARLIPLATVPDHVDEIDRSVPVHLICAAGGRSMQAAVYLDDLGFDTVNVAGGTKEWLARGKAFETGSADS